MWGCLSLLAAAGLLFVGVLFAKNIQLMYSITLSDALVFVFGTAIFCLPFFLVIVTLKRYDTEIGPFLRKRLGR